MATGLKKHYADIRFSGNLVTPDEIDRYEVVTIMNPSTKLVFGTCAGTSTQAKALVFDQVVLDYPRSIDMVISCASGSTKGGTATITGWDQFGVAQTETFAQTAIANGGTVQGTKVWAKVTSPGTFTFATSNAGNGTCEIKGGTAGSVALFGLPFKIGAATDIKVFNAGTNNFSINVGGGTYSAFVSTAKHAIIAPNDLPSVGTATNLTGPNYFTVWAKPTYNAENEGSPRMTNL